MLKLRMLIEEVRTLLEINNNLFTDYSGSNMVWLAGFMCSQLLGNMLGNCFIKQLTAAAVT